MGGKAFAGRDPPIPTPRLPVVEYFGIRDEFLRRLRKYFKYADTPIEAPDKDTFGDVDICLAEPKLAAIDACVDRNRNYLPDGSRELLKDALSRLKLADKSREEQAVLLSLTPFATMNGCATLAVPKPRLRSTRRPVGDSNNRLNAESTGAAAAAATVFVQVDINICEDRESFDWHLFQKAHGDLWNILGSSIRRFGLTVTDDGLFVRIAEIEDHDRKASRVFVTRDPVEVLAILGLKSYPPYSLPFQSLEDMFRYACTMRFFRPEAYVVRDLKANDRKRLKGREAYRKFVTEWVPNGPPSPEDAPPEPQTDDEPKWQALRGIHCQKQPGVEDTRNSVLEEMFLRPGVRESYDQKLQAWREERAKKEEKAKRRREAKAQMDLREAAASQSASPSSSEVFYDAEEDLSSSITEQEGC